MRPHRAILILAAMFATLPLVVFGCSCGHDFGFHALNWMEVAAQWHQGVLYPRWAASAAYGAGEPRFVFYPPLSWALGALLGLVLPWGATPAAYTAIVLCGCGLSMHRLAREWVGPNAALLAAAIYAVNPYLLFVAYERTAYAELMAAVWLPLLLLGILRRKVTVTGIAVPVALLWLTNAPAAVMGCYALALLAAARLATGGFAQQAGRTGDAGDGRFLFAMKTVAGTALGVALAAFYIVPAAYERRWVQIQMAMVPGMRIQDNFLFGHTSDPDHDIVLRSASWIAVTLVVATAVAAWLALRRKSSARGSASIGLCILASVILFLQLPFSAPVWRLAPELAFLQFPWRWLAVLSVAMALLIAFCVGDSRRGKVGRVALAALPLVLIASAYQLFHQPCDPEDTIAARLQLFTSGAGSEPTDEYTPLTADNDALQHAMPVASLVGDVDDPMVVGTAGVAIEGRSAEHWQVSATSGSAQFLVLRLRDYPAWGVRVNGALVTTRPQRDDGLMVVPIGVGRSDIDVSYGRTMDQSIGDGISAAALLGFVLMQLSRRRSAA